MENMESAEKINKLERFFARENVFICALPTPEAVDRKCLQNISSAE